MGARPSGWRIGDPGQQRTERRKTTPPRTMPQLRTTPARVETARRIVVEELWRLLRYTWTAADQRMLEDKLIQDMLAEQWVSTIDMADYMFSWVRANW